MDNAVPAVLQRLRAADIVRMVGLKVASLGQEYYRLGAVQQTQRQGHRLSGVVNVPRVPVVLDDREAKTTNAVDDLTALEVKEHSCIVEIVLESSTSWKNFCTCDVSPSTLCAHAAALLYQWLFRPFSFTTSSSSPVSSEIDSHSIVPVQPVHSEETASTEANGFFLRETPESAVVEHETEMARLVKAGSQPGSSKASLVPRGPTPLVGIAEMLAQLGLSDLRNIAREYEVSTNGLSKQLLVEAILEMLRQPEVVRHVAMTLEKPQRQLLAALTLAGGTMTDDDLRGMFERFGLGQPPQLQQSLAALQSKGLLFRTSLNSSPQQRIGLSGSLLDVGWFVPVEVRSALRVSVPVTAFDVEQTDEAGEKPIVRYSEPYRLLATLLLVARALEGYQLTREDLRGGLTSAGSSSRPTVPLSPDGSIALPAPSEWPSAALLTALHQAIPYPLSLLRFAVRLLRLADVVYMDGAQARNFRVLANAATLLLGSPHAEVVHDLFELWLTQSSYDELFELQEEGVHLRCRATSMHHPLLRQGELEAENSEARQAIVALLAQAPLNRWLHFSAFARFVYRLNPLFLQRRQRLFSPPHWWLEREEGRPLRPLSMNDWWRAEYYYLARLIRGPLHWLGACDLALGPDGRLMGFRLTPIADWLFNGQPLDEEQAGKTADAVPGNAAHVLEITEQDDLLVTSSIDTWPVIQLLEDFAESTGVRNGKLCYRLSPQSLATALSRGLQPVPLLALLRSLATAEPALERLLAQLERWIANYGRIRIYTQVALLQASDTTVMRELAATTSLDEQIVQRLHATLFVLKRSGVEQIVEELKRRGQAPLLHYEELYGTE
jgi:hypothetical protein